MTGERLARRWFSLVASGDFERLTEMLHDDVRLVSRVKAGTVVEGREDAARFIQETVATRLYEASADVFTPIDESRVVVEGRMRWIDEDRVIRDDPVVWAMEFRDGLLLTFLPARTTIEAEAVLTHPH
jgi:SnoaL-like protein